jgi:hypothetical protein
LQREKLFEQEMDEWWLMEDELITEQELNGDDW